MPLPGCGQSVCRRRLNSGAPEAEDAEAMAPSSPAAHPGTGRAFSMCGM